MGLLIFSRVASSCDVCLPGGGQYRMFAVVLLTIIALSQRHSEAQPQQAAWVQRHLALISLVAGDWWHLALFGQ